MPKERDPTLDRLNNDTLRTAVRAHLRTVERVANAADTALDKMTDWSCCNRLRQIRAEAGKALVLLNPDETCES